MGFWATRAVRPSNRRQFQQQQQLKKAAPTAARSRYANRVPSCVLTGHVALGGLQIVAGCLTVLSTLAAFLVGQGYSKSSGGFAFGPVFVAAGGTGMAAGLRCGNTRCLVAACLTLSLVACCLGLIGAYMVAVTASWNFRSRRNSTSMGGPGGGRTPRFESAAADDAAFRAVMIGGVASCTVCLLEFLLAVAHSAFACRAACCFLPPAPDEPEAGEEPPLSSAAGDQEVAFSPGQQIAFHPGQHPGFLSGMQSSVLPGQQAAGNLSLGELLRLTPPPEYEVISCESAVVESQ